MSQHAIEDNKIVSLQNEAIEESQRRPWVRFFARYIDVSLFSFLLRFFFPIFEIPILKNEIVFTMIILFFWTWVESLFLSTIGTTFGKWLLKVHLSPKGNIKKITFSSALKRSFRVWFKGLAIGFPIVSLFTSIAAYSDLTKRGITSWDKDGGFKVTHEKIGYIKISIILLIYLAIVLLSHLYF